MNHPIILENSIRDRKYYPHFTSEELINREAECVVQGHKAGESICGQRAGFYVLLHPLTVGCQGRATKVALWTWKKMEEDTMLIDRLPCARDCARHFILVFCPILITTIWTNMWNIWDCCPNEQSETYIGDWTSLSRFQNLCCSHYVWLLLDFCFCFYFIGILKASGTSSWAAFSFKASAFPQAPNLLWPQDTPFPFDCYCFLSCPSRSP